MSTQIAELGDPALFDADFVYDSGGGDITLDSKFMGSTSHPSGLSIPIWPCSPVPISSSNRTWG